MKKKIINFSKYNPSGNMTVLVHSKHCPSEYAAISNRIMDISHIYCEQVGFLTITKDQYFQLEMSGNEFCGNATISYLHYLNEQNLLDSSNVEIMVSGRTELVKCQVCTDGKYEVAMPKPIRIRNIQLQIDKVSYQTTEVIYETYIHVIILVKKVTEQMKKSIETYVSTNKWNHSLKTIGIMLLNVSTQYLIPLIYIPKTNSSIWEKSCGSGSASIGIYESWSKKKSVHKLEIKQPGGSIWVSSNINNFETYIIGKVSTVAIGQAFI